VDFAAAPGVDVVLKDPYTLPFKQASIDVAVSNSCFEHSEMFWLLFLEILRVLKPDGLFYLNARRTENSPLSVDCWRFIPTAAGALVNGPCATATTRCCSNPSSARQDQDSWNDFVAVFVARRRHAGRYRAGFSIPSRSSPTHTRRSPGPHHPAS